MNIVIIFTLGILIGAFALVVLKPKTKESKSANCGHCENDCGKCK